MVDGAQLPLRFDVKQNYFPEDFLKSESNALALSALEAWPHWLVYGLLIFGAHKVGKTHLAHVFQSTSRALFLHPKDLKSLDDFDPLILPGRAYIVDDASSPDISEQSLFHLCNLIKERKGTLLLTAEQPPALWPLQLADLRSRLALFPALRIERPDDDLLEAILVKKISEMQIDLDPAVRKYILRHIERSSGFLVRFLEELDTQSLRAQRAITIPFVKRVLRQF
ncbi:MAG: hypothetical protein A2977_02755 [Alphaproteobacteria bacterium RIFCSPLOWO2_01_FULL_45_8]|nr:MAG: hypothetical protein A2065_03910 [Alphaproteobacteria bacterium GWB1_45_5]OFW75950.1 MAG: hypothetical protein A3K20_03960 [Alphaproteobacteria bacterium GWA1_45_9]OFW90042.1 MAG: hypothetical protein A2621_04165 [Alphaproteobacteria bacterium RIFCSPHIGHO2_01_FULL_41_14]OFW96673.1 MAG: hypothetical protein A2977_02755 [Alphaproteobacteria bacterium RIFCSPLOWO2_01_FULL_45_8]